MRGSWRLGRLFGIDVKVHFTFALLLAVLAGVHLWSGGTSGMVSGVLFALALFGSVLLHEFGHALTARRYGIATRDITLLPIGGVAQLEGMPKKPSAEAAIALAGPAVNFAIAAVLAGAIYLATGAAPFSELSNPAAASFAERLLATNVGLALFNLLPAFPLDGGRVLRALLSWRMGHVSATRVAATLGRALAVVLGVVGILGNPMLALVALFIWFAAGSERRAAELDSALTDARAARLVSNVLPTLSPADRLAVAAQAFLVHAAPALPVATGGRIVGALDRDELVDGLARFGPDAQVEVLRIETLPSMSHASPLGEMLPRVMGRPGMAVVVDASGEPMGVVRADQILLFASLAQAGREFEARWAAASGRARTAEEA